MDLIIKPTEKCNFRCTFCSSTKIADNPSSELEHELIFRFLKRFPETNTIIVNGGDPLMMKPEWYWPIIEFLDRENMPTTISFTTNLWPFYKNPERWKELFNHPRMGIGTSFQYGGGRLKGDLTEFSEEDFWKCSDAMLEHCGYRPDFIAVVTEENKHDAIKNVELAKRMGVQCKLNYAVSSGPQVTDPRTGHVMGALGKPFLKADVYEIYLQIWRLGLAEYEYNTQQMMKKLRGESTTCPLNRACDDGIRTLQPDGDYYSCGAFGDDREYSIDFEAEMAGEKILPLKYQPELMSMKESCFTCPMFDICNGCKKTISDYKRNGLVEQHCQKMKSLAPDIIEANGMTGRLEPTPYVNEAKDQPKRQPIFLLQLQV